MIAAALLTAGLVLAAPPSGEADGAETSSAALAELEALDEEGLTPLGAENAADIGLQFLHTLFVLGAVCLLAYLILGKALPRILRVPMPTASQRLMTVVDRLPLDPKRSILIVAMGEQHFMVGSTEQGLTLLSRLDGGDVRDAAVAAETKARDVGPRLPFFGRRPEQNP